MTRMSTTHPRIDAVRNASWLAAGTLVARVAGFAMAVALARTLGVDEYGLYAFAVAIGALLEPVADLGLTPFITREVARQPDDRGLALRLARVKALASFGMLALAAILAVSTTDDADLVVAVIAMSAVMLMDGAAMFAFGYFQGREQMRLEGLATAGFATVRAIGAIAIAVATHELIPVLAWLVVASALQLAIALVAMVRELRPRVPALASIEWRSVAAMGLIGVFAITYLRADSVIIGWTLGDQEVGLYAAAYAIVFGLQVVPLRIATAVAPVFTRTYKHDPPAFAATWQEGTRLILAIVLPFAVVTSVLAEDLISFFFGPEFESAGAALAILVWSSPVWAANMLLTAVLRGVGRERAIAAATGAGMVLNLSLNVWAIPAYGIEAAAAITIATEGLVLIAQSMVASSHNLVAVPKLPWLKILAAVGLAAAVSIVAAGIHVVVAAAAALAASAILLLVTGVLDPREFSALRARSPR